MFLSLLFFLSYLYGCHILSFWTGNGTSQSALDHFESNQANKQSGFPLGVVVNPFFWSMSSPSVFYVVRQLVKCAWLYRPREKSTRPKEQCQSQSTIFNLTWRWHSSTDSMFCCSRTIFRRGTVSAGFCLPCISSYIFFWLLLKNCILFIPILPSLIYSTSPKLSPLGNFQCLEVLSKLLMEVW